MTITLNMWHWVEANVHVVGVVIKVVSRRLKL